jgi:hypothetical protein
VLLTLSLNEKNSSNHHNSYNKGPNLEYNRVLVPSLLPTVVPSSSTTLLCTQPTSTTLFPILSKLIGSVLSFEDLTNNSNGLLESTLNFPSTTKVSKIQLEIGIVIVCPKSLNSIYGIHSPLGVNKAIVSTFFSYEFGFLVLCKLVIHIRKPLQPLLKNTHKKLSQKGSLLKYFSSPILLTRVSKKLSPWMSLLFFLYLLNPNEWMKIR